MNNITPDTGHLIKVNKNTLPNLKNAEITQTSNYDISYNCIAHVINLSDVWLWPINDSAHMNTYWPINIPRMINVTVYKKLFEWIKYSTVEVFHAENYKQGFQKIAIYCDIYNRPTHVTRQIINEDNIGHEENGQAK
jgi:hypothetical protein